jgi:hypothetical protein
MYILYTSEKEEEGKNITYEKIYIAYIISMLGGYAKEQN